MDYYKGTVGQHFWIYRLKSMFYILLKYLSHSYSTLEGKLGKYTSANKTQDRWLFQIFSLYKSSWKFSD